MTNLDCHELATDAANAARPPAFETLQRRAAIRRRRQTVGALAAVVIVVAGITGAVNLASTHTAAVDPANGPTPTPSPTGTGPTPTKSARPHGLTAEQIADVDGSTLVDVTGARDGLLTVWQRCTASGRCQYAWKRMTGPPSVGMLHGRGPWSATAAGDRFVLTDGSTDGGGLIVDLDGHVTPISKGAPQPWGPSVVAVTGGAGVSVVDAAHARRWPLSRPAGVARWSSASIGTGGEIWAFGSPTATESSQQDIALWHSTNGGASWTSRPLQVGAPTMPGYIAAAGTHVAALGTYDGATVAPVGDLAISSDDGRTWHDLARGDLPFEYVDSMAAADGGPLYVVGGELDGGGAPKLYRSTDDTWTQFAEVTDGLDGDTVGSLKPAADAVVGRVSTGQLVTLETDGTVTRVRP